MIIRMFSFCFFFFSSRRRHTRSLCDWSQTCALPISALEQELAPLQRAANEADWQLNVTGEQRWEEESTRLETEIRSVLSRPEPYRVLREAAASDGVEDRKSVV